MDPLCVIADLLCSDVDQLDVIADLLGAVIDPVGVLVNALLNRDLSNASDDLCSRLGAAYLVIGNGIR